MPETYTPIWLTAWKEEDLIGIIDTVRGLRLDRTLEGVPRLYNTVVFASLVAERSAGTTARARRRIPSSTRSPVISASADGR
jgi:hypothetical protein